MRNSVTLTIGIPTYNRVEAVSERVRELLELKKEFDFTILVIDNASTDGTAEKLQIEFANEDVNVRLNPENVGLAGNLLRLIDVADTEYLTFVSDEDKVERDGLLALMALLAEREPQLVSPRAQVGDDPCYRGRRSTRPITAEELNSAAFYLSGITVHLAGAKSGASSVSALLPENAAAVYYPQVLITALAMLGGEALFLDALLTRQVVELKTHLSSYGRDAYWFVPGRWAQFEGYEQFFAETTDRLPEQSAMINRMRATTRAGVFALLESAAVAQFPELADHRPPVKESLVGRLSRVIRRR